MYIKYGSKILYVHFYQGFKKLIAFSSIFFLSNHYIYYSGTVILDLEVKQSLMLENQCKFFTWILSSKIFWVLW